jgi:para-aminobenzoate synthetase/4-amino-4-deoxychorismate lyase
MRIINELEAGPRRIYTGTIGYFSPGRRARFNVAIRTALVDRQEKKVEYGVGGGIVWDSTSADEYAEALLKARILTNAPLQFSLLETMLWTPGAGFLLQDKHIERLLDSAAYFDFTITKESVVDKLRSLASAFDRPQRVRLLVDREGNIEISSTPISLQARPVTAALAEKPVDSSDPFLFHKTTRREVYDLLYNERGELTEFTIGNLVVELDGELITPPLACGLLSGTFRAHLLETGKVVERIVPVHRLKECTKIYRVNSVRKWETVIIL